MSEENKPVEGMPEPVRLNPPEDPQLRVLWDQYLQKCCEAGQYIHQLDQLDGQKRQLEKYLELANMAAKKAASQHKDLLQELRSKPSDTPKLEMKESD